MLLFQTLSPALRLLPPLTSARCGARITRCRSSDNSRAPLVTPLATSTDDQSTPYTPQTPQPITRPRGGPLLRIHARRPIWTYVIIALNFGVLLVQKLGLLLAAVVPALACVPNLQALGAKVSTKIVSGQLWRLITPAFLHVNLRHLLLNTYALYALGSATEILYGSSAFASIYLSGALGGNVASFCANATSTRPSVGSSGAVFALIAAMCVHLDRNRGPIGPLARENLRLVATATILNLAGGWLMPSVDGWAHFGGCLFGVVTAAKLAPQVVLHRSSDTGRLTFVEVRRHGKRASAVAALAALGFSIAIAGGVIAAAGGSDALVHAYAKVARNVLK